MSHITVYLDEKTEAFVRARARRAKTSVSGWIRNAVGRAAEKSWPTEVVDLAGQWRDFPSANQIRASLSEDTPRVIS